MKQALDCELPGVELVNGTAMYEVVIVATDQGNPQLTATAQVHFKHI